MTACDPAICERCGKPGERSGDRINPDGWFFLAAKFGWYCDRGRTARIDYCPKCLAGASESPVAPGTVTLPAEFREDG